MQRSTPSTAASSACSRTSSCPPSSSSRKERVGARLRRRYDAPRTPLERVLACADVDHAKVAALVALRDRLDPFVLAATIDRQLEAIFALANHRQSPARAAAAPSPAPPASPPPPTPKRRTGFQPLMFGAPAGTMTAAAWSHHEWRDDHPFGHI